MAVDLLERLAEPLAAFAVEAADRAAQAVDRLGQLGLFGGAAAVLGFDPFEFFGGHQIDRADPLACRGQPVHFGAGFLGAGHAVGGEGEAFGEQRGRALEALARDPAHFDPARILVLRACGEPGAGLARAGEGFGGDGGGTVGFGRGVLRGFGGGFGGGEIGGDARADPVALFDFAHQPRGLGGDDGALLADFLEPSRHFGEAFGGIAAARLPPGDIAALGARALTRNGQRLIVHGQARHRGLERSARAFVASPRGFERGAPRGGIRQLFPFGLGGSEVLHRGRKRRRLLAGLAIEFGDTRGGAFARAFGLVQGAQGMALGLCRLGQRPIGSDKIALELGEFGRSAIMRGLRCGDRLLQRRELCAELAEAVLGLEPRRLGGTFAARDEAVPAPQRAIAGYEPLARPERTPVVAVRDMHQRQPGGEFGRAVGDMGSEVVGDGRGGCGAGPESPLIAPRRSEQRLAVAPQHCRKRAFVAAFRAHRVERLPLPGAVLGSLGACLAVAPQRLMLACGTGKPSPGTCERGRGVIVRCLQIGLARLHLLELGALEDHGACRGLRLLARSLDTRRAIARGQ